MVPVVVVVVVLLLLLLAAMVVVGVGVLVVGWCGSFVRSGTLRQQEMQQS